MYERLNLVRRPTNTRKEINKNLKFTQRRYKNDRDRHVPYPQMFKAGYYVYLDRQSLFRSAAERSATWVYKKPLSQKHGPY